MLITTTFFQKQIKMYIIHFFNFFKFLSIVLNLRNFIYTLKRIYSKCVFLEPPFLVYNFYGWNYRKVQDRQKTGGWINLCVGVERKLYTYTIYTLYPCLYRIYSFLSWWTFAIIISTLEIVYTRRKKKKLILRL